MSENGIQKGGMVNGMCVGFSSLARVDDTFLMLRNWGGGARTVGKKRDETVMRPDGGS